tara:strand:+ start:4864 stop:5076 length:213 start_codon:yes stop_codon:yes gene_type:complete
MKLGLKNTHLIKFGQKAVHSAAKFGEKSSNALQKIAPIAGLALGPEVGGGLEVAGLVGKEVSKGLEKLTK